MWWSSWSRVGQDEGIKVTSRTTSSSNGAESSTLNRSNFVCPLVTREDQAEETAPSTVPVSAPGAADSIQPGCSLRAYILHHYWHYLKEFSYLVLSYAYRPDNVQQVLCDRIAGKMDELESLMCPHCHRVDDGRLFTNYGRDHARRFINAARWRWRSIEARPRFSCPSVLSRFTHDDIRVTIRREGRRSRRHVPTGDNRWLNSILPNARIRIWMWWCNNRSLFLFQTGSSHSPSVRISCLTYNLAIFCPNDCTVHIWAIQQNKKTTTM